MIDSCFKTANSDADLHAGTCLATQHNAFVFVSVYLFVMKDLTAN